MNHVNKTDLIKTIIFKTILNRGFALIDKLPTKRDMAGRAGTGRGIARCSSCFFVSSRISTLCHDNIEMEQSEFYSVSTGKSEVSQ